MRIDISINRTRAMVVTMMIIALVMTMMPASSYALSSDAYKQRMDTAQANIEKYEAQLVKDQKALEEAQALLDAKKSTYEGQKNKLDEAEYLLNKGSRRYVESKVIEAWPNDVEDMKKNNSWLYKKMLEKDPNYYTEGYKHDLPEGYYKTFSKSSNTTIRNAMKAYNDISPDAFDKEVTNTLGYFNELKALELIDECNKIRASKSTLAQYYVDVMGEPVPDGVKQLRIRPCFMISSAMNNVLNLPKIKGHIYTGTHGQNAHGGHIGYGGTMGSPFQAWWYLENHNKAKNKHNGNIADPDWETTGFAVSNPGKNFYEFFATQDFSYNDRGQKTYSVAEYRDGLVSYCKSRLNIYERCYDYFVNAESKYKDAEAAYRTAEANYNATKKQISNWTMEYNSAKSLYDYQLEIENDNPKSDPVVKYTVTFVDGLDYSILSRQTVAAGGNGVPPAPPVHEGYRFTGWDKDTYRNVQKKVTTYALYEKIASSTKPGRDSGMLDAEEIEAAIVNAGNDEGPAGTAFAPLRLKSDRQTNTSVRLTWTKAKGAGSYVIYGNLCNKANKMKKIATVKSGVTSRTIKKAAGKQLKKGKYYKFIVVALDKDGKVLSLSKTVHVATKGGKAGNYKSVTVGKTILNKAKALQAGKTLRLKAKAVKASGHTVKQHRALKYESTNTRVATVTSKGVIKAKAEGSCYVYAYAQNGVAKKVKVVVD